MPMALNDSWFFLGSQFPTVWKVWNIKIQGLLACCLKTEHGTLWKIVDAFQHKSAID